MPRRAGRSRKLFPAGRPVAGSKSLAEALAGRLAAAIERGAVEVGELLPPERELAVRHRLGRVTVRTALGRLVRTGLIESRPGVGHMVVRREARAEDAGPVGLIYCDLHDLGASASKSVAAIEASLAKAGRALLISSSGLNAGREDDCIRRFRAAGASALVIVPATEGARSRELEKWIRRGRPAVLEGHPGRWLLPDELAARCDQVDVDNRGGLRLAAEHLAGLGHRRLGFISPMPASGSERHAAFKEIVNELGLEAREEWIAPGLESGRAGGRAAFERLAAGEELPTAVVAANDDTALGFIDAARGAGLDCPGDVSVTGFDNESAEGPGALAGLTTVDFSREELAREVVRLLTARSSGGRRKPEKVSLPARLLVRKSCAAPKVGAGA